MTDTISTRFLAFLDEVDKGDKPTFEAMLGLAILTHLLDGVDIDEIKPVMESFFDTVRIRVDLLIAGAEA